MGGRRRLFDHGGVLLGELIHLADCNIYFVETACLLFGGCGDLGNKTVDAGHTVDDSLQRLPGLADQAALKSSLSF